LRCPDEPLIALIKSLKGENSLLVLTFAQGCKSHAAFVPVAEEASAFSIRGNFLSSSFLTNHFGKH
jgi:hypothetical protein